MLITKIWEYATRCAQLRLRLDQNEKSLGIYLSGHHLAVIKKLSGSRQSVIKILKSSKPSFFVHCTKMQLITFQNFNIQACFSQFLWFSSLKCWFKGHMISRIHLGLPNLYKLMCFDRNINGNRNVIFLWLFACAMVRETHFR